VTDRRHAKRLDGVSEVTVTDEGGAQLAIASIGDLSETGLLMIFVPPADLARFSVGQKVRFQFVLATGAVTGSAEVVRKVDGEIGLRTTKLDSDANESALKRFLHSSLGGI